MDASATQIYEFGKFRVDAAKHLLLQQDGETVPLKPKVFETLLYLIQNRGRVLEKDELLNAIWTDTIVEENNLSQNISILRRVLGEIKNQHCFIVTIPGRGYKFVAEVREIAYNPAAQSAADEQKPADEIALIYSAEPALGTERLVPEQQTSKHLQTSRFWFVALTIVVIFALGTLGFYIWRGGQQSANLPIKSIAVLPFKPLVIENRSESLELGMADTLINKFSSSEAIIVRPLGSVRRFNNLEQDVLQAGRELGVDSVLDGTIQTSGDRVRIAARLVRIIDGKQLWTETFDEKLTDIFSVQDSISQRVLSALTLQLSGEAQTRLKRRDTANVEAYQLYMKGRFHVSRLILPEAKKGIEYYNQAIAIDPNYALAYVGIAQAYTAFSLTGDVPANEAMPKAKLAAQKAVEIDPDLPDSQVAVGILAFWYDWNFAEAEKKYQRALELDPNNAFAYFYYGNLKSILGQNAEAVRLGKRARELDPLSLITNSAEGQYLYYAGYTDEAVSRLNKTLDLNPNFWHSHLILSNIYIEKQMYAEAVAEAAMAAQFSGGNSQPIAVKGCALAKSGDVAGARTVLAELHALSTERYVPAYNFAIIYNALGETDTALSYLEKAYAEKNVLMVFIKVDPKWNNLRDQPSFIELMRRMNFE